MAKGRIIVRGKLGTRGKAKRADYILYHQHFPITLIEAKDNNFVHSLIGESWPLSNVLALMSMQVNRGMAWVYRRYAKDHDLYVLEHGGKSRKAGTMGRFFSYSPLAMAKT